jgi:transcriptional regulator with XRE-family HTH domain
MRGIDLKNWREGRHWKQTDLMAELDIKSRQTVITWEASERVPRLVELAIIALDQVEGCSARTGYEKQFTREKIVNRWFDLSKRLFPVKGGRIMCN